MNSMGASSINLTLRADGAAISALVLSIGLWPISSTESSADRNMERDITAESGTHHVYAQRIFLALSLREFSLVRTARASHSAYGVRQVACTRILATSYRDLIIGLSSPLSDRYHLQQSLRLGSLSEPDWLQQPRWLPPLSNCLRKANQLCSSSLHRVSSYLER